MDWINLYKPKCNGDYTQKNKTIYLAPINKVMFDWGLYLRLSTDGCELLGTQHKKMSPWFCYLQSSLYNPCSVYSHPRHPVTVPSGTDCRTGVRTRAANRPPHSVWRPTRAHVVLLLWAWLEGWTNKFREQDIRIQPEWVPTETSATQQKRLLQIINWTQLQMIRKWCVSAMLSQKSYPPARSSCAVLLQILNKICCWKNCDKVF